MGWCEGEFLGISFFRFKNCVRSAKFRPFIAGPSAPRVYMYLWVGFREIWLRKSNRGFRKSGQIPWVAKNKLFVICPKHPKTWSKISNFWVKM